MQTDTQTPPISSSTAIDADFRLGANAIRRIAKLLKDEPEGSLLRVAVIGGGCSGFQYKFDFETTAPESDDIVINQDGAKVAVDATSMEFLRGSMLDYVETLGGAAFEIRNPNSKASCGCGNSFSVM